MDAYIPYGLYWSTPFAKWQGSLANMNALRLAAITGRSALEARRMPMEQIDLAILGHTNPQKGSFYGLPYVTGLMGIDGVAGPSVQQACATSTRSLQMAAQEVVGGTASCALLVMCDRLSNGAILYYPDPSGPGGYGQTEHWVPDNMACDPYAGEAMLVTGENVAARYGIGTAEQHELKLHRYHQYQAALADDRAFQRRYMVEAPIFDSRFRKQIGSLAADEGVFPTTAEGLAKLKPVREGGTITFGGQTHPADGNAGAIVTTRERARELATDAGIEVELLGFGQARVEKAHMPMAPAPAAIKALAHAGIGIAQVDAVKTHNPFAVNDIALAKDTGFAWQKMNNFGSSIVWGHPQGATGLRGVIELIEELVLRGGGVGVFAGCAAGDTGVALVLRVTDSRKGLTPLRSQGTPMKVITADQVGPLVPDEATIFLGGLAVTSLPEEILQGLERHFLATGHPRMVSTWACGAVGNSGEAGMKHFAHPGMIKRVVAGHFGQTGKEMMKMVFDGEVEAYNFPQGSLSHLTRQIANRSPGLLTQVGLGTFVDPRQEGGRMNPRSTAPLVKLVEFDGQEWLHYPSPKIDVAIIRGTVADERGNITLDKEGVILEQLSIAQAAKRWGGTVIVQVERIVKAGTLHPKAVKVPGFLVDYVVVAKPDNHMQTITTQFDPALCGDIRVPVGSLAAMPLDERKVIARRAALEVHAGKLSNLGIGIPAGIPAVAAEEGVADRLTLSIESGVNGGVPAQLGDFGLAYNAESIIEQSFQFDFYDGGGLDASFLGLAQTDAQGNVNVSKFNGRPVGCGGFINITRSTPNLVFCGAFTAGGLEVAIGDGQLKIVKEGRNPKFIAQVEQITFNGKDAALRRQNVTFVTERAVFKLREEGLELVEIAPGIDLERDVLAHMAFKPLMRDVKVMDAGIFSERWGGLAKRWAEQH